MRRLIILVFTAVVSLVTVPSAASATTICVPEKVNTNVKSPTTGGVCSAGFVLIEPGKEGKEGKQGIQGVPGEQGPRGEKGTTGASGPAGPEGPEGKEGKTGPTGPEGPELKIEGSYSGFATRTVGTEYEPSSTHAVFVTIKALPLGPGISILVEAYVGGVLVTESQQDKGAGESENIISSGFIVPAGKKWKVTGTSINTLQSNYLAL